MYRTHRVSRFTALSFRIFFGSWLLLPGTHAISWSAPPEKQMVERLEASINNSVLLNSDLRKFRGQIKLRAQLDPLFSSSPIATQEKPTDAQIRDFLIDEKLISQQFPVTDAEVEQEINTIQSNNRLTRESLIAAIQTEGHGVKDYFELIRIGASKRNLLDRDIRTKVSISDDDVKIIISTSMLTPVKLLGPIDST